MLSVKSIKIKRRGCKGAQAINIKYSGWKPTKEAEENVKIWKKKSRKKATRTHEISKGIESTKADGRGGTIRG
jgi:hypothetical protein